MNRITYFIGLFILIFSWPVAIYAEDSEKDYIKLIMKLDVSEETMKCDRSDLSNFWRSVTENDKDLQKLLDNVIYKPNGTGKSIQKELSLMPRLNPKYYPYAITDDGMMQVIEDFKSDVGITGDDIEICIIDDSDINAFATYSENGKVICVNTGILKAKGITRDMVLGVILHEMVHCKMEHIIEQLYAQKKRKKRDDILAGIAAGLNAAAAGADSYAAGMTGNKANTDRYVQNIENLKLHKEQDLFKYYNSFSKELEFEADLIAFRFMQWYGYDESAYIEMLRVLESNQYDSYQVWESDKESDHPTLRRRINFLTYVMQHPEITKESAKEKKKELQIKKNTSDSFDPLYN